jgi:hypothetical protein
VPHFDKTKIILCVSLMASLLLYFGGVKFALVGACLAAGVLLLPPVAVMSSLVGRLFLSLFVFVAAFQAAAAIQFFAFPSSGFAAPAAIAVAIYLIAALLTDLRTTGVKEKIAGLGNRYDAAGAIVAAIFLLPFIPILIGDDTVARVAQIGGAQAVDATNHFAYIAQMMAGQHWVYEVDNYYPKSFHIVTAFLQDSLFVPQTSMDWRPAVFVFIGQYLVFGVLLAGAFGYFLSSASTALAQRYTMKHPRLLLLATSVAAGAIVGPLLLWPFVQQGFLSYYYVITTILLAFAVLMTGPKDRLFSTMWLYLVLIFGAGLSWPLLIPPLLATLAFLLCQGSYLRLLLGMPKRHLLGLGALVAVQFIPIGFQLRYTGSDSNINALGGLTAFHPLSLLLSALIVLGIAANPKMEREPREKSVALVLPLLTFVGALALMQLFLKGEVRYYVIKTAFLLESLNVVFLSCLVAVALSRIDIGAVGRFFAVASVPAVVMFALFAVTANPLADVRNLFRTEANQVKPDFYDADLRLYAKLGEAGEIDGFNTTLLHYNAVNNAYSAHLQTAFWANMLQYDGRPDDESALLCNGKIYGKFGFGGITHTEEMQAQWIEGVKNCARLTKELGGEHVILTDPASVDLIRGEFGDVARVETYEGKG